MESEFGKIYIYKKLSSVHFYKHKFVDFCLYLKCYEYYHEWSVYLIIFIRLWFELWREKNLQQRISIKLFINYKNKKTLVDFNAQCNKTALYFLVRSVNISEASRVLCVIWSIDLNRNFWIRIPIKYQLIWNISRISTSKFVDKNRNHKLVTLPEQRVCSSLLCHAHLQ